MTNQKRYPKASFGITYHSLVAVHAVVMDAGHQNFTRDDILNETVYQWYIDFGQSHATSKMLEIYPEFKGSVDVKMRNKIGSLAFSVKNASPAVRRDILSKPFKPPGFRALRNQTHGRQKSDDEDDSPTEEVTLGVGKRKAANRARVNYNVRELANHRGYQAYDAEGRLLNNGGFDLCDCLESQCPGCHFACLRCGSEKCGSECRSRRKWTFDHIEIEGTDFKVRFPNL